MWWMGFVAGALALDCPGPVPAEALSASLDAAEVAWKDLDDAGFRDAVNEAAGVQLPCVGEALAPALAGRTHLLLAMHLSAIGDEANAAASASAARAADPALVVPPDLLPPDHPVRLAFEAAPTAPKRRKVPEPREGSLAFDGASGRLRPAGAPTVLQVLDETGLPRLTTYLGSREPLPAYAAVPRRRNALLACAGGSLALSGGTFAWGWSRRSALLAEAADPTVPAERLDGLRAAGNGAAVLSGVLFGAAAGCGAGAAAIGPR